MVEIILGIITSTATIIVAIINAKTNKKINNISDIKYNFDKTYLTDYISEVENGVQKTEIQKQRASEIYDEYTELKGNSYVHTHWEKLARENKV